MSTAAPSTPASTTVDGASTTLLGRIIELTARAATSWLGLTAGYFVALLGAVIAFQKLEDPFKGAPWLRYVLLGASAAFVLFGHTIPALIDQRRRKRLKEISGELKPGYFRLSPREEEEGFTRSDNTHEEILRWVKDRRAPILYLTGQSGSGKSSILSAWVVPRLRKQDPAVKVIQLRGYQDPLSVLSAKLREPDVIWSRPPATSDDRELLERTCQKLGREPLFIIFDQFEEFVILQDETKRKPFETLLASLVNKPIDGLTMLLVLRTDYVEVLEKLALPKLVQDANWKAVPSFTEQAARGFLRGSGLAIDEDVERDVLREAAEIEQAKGLIRPVTLNVCGLVLGRFATGLPRGFRPGGMIRSFVRESVELPQIREVTPKLIPHLISNYVTKRPRTVTELAEETKLDEATVRGCLRVLAQPDRGVVRPLDREQERWEISHDFLVPLLDGIFARWSVSFWRGMRPFLPWIAAGSMALLTIAVSVRPKDAMVELTDLGWRVTPEEKGELKFSCAGEPLWAKSARAFRRLQRPFGVDVSRRSAFAEPIVLDSLAGIELLRESSLASLNLDGTKVTDLGPLRELKSLSSLNLEDTKVTDLGPLRELKSLSSLKLSFTHVTDLSPLRELKSLSFLSLSFTHVTDLSPLRELKSLSTLYLPYAKVITDLSPLRELKSLSTLNLSYSTVTDHTTLAILTQRGVTVLER